MRDSQQDMPPQGPLTGSRSVTGDARPEAVGWAARRLCAVLVATLVGLLLQCASSAGLWWPGAGAWFPCIPLAGVLVPLDSPWPDRLTAIGLLAATLSLLYRQLPVAARRTSGTSVATGAAVILLGMLAVLLNQHRGQVWWWHAAGMVLLADATAPAQTLRRWRRFVVSIYLWSALSKLDRAFAATHGSLLMQTLLQFAGIQARWWPAAAQESLGWFPPVFELLAAVLLIFRQTRPIGLCSVLSMHAALLLVLSPWGLHHSLGVLLWNATFLVQDVLLFRGPGGRVRGSAVAPVHSAVAADGPHSAARDAGGWAQTGMSRFGSTTPLVRRWRDIAAAALAIVPGLWYAGLLDDWPAWAVYAARTPRVSVQIRSDAANGPRFPSHLRRYLRVVPATAEWLALDVDRWSLDAVGAPKYPGERFSVGVAIALAERIGADAVRVTVHPRTARSRDTGEAGGGKRTRRATGEYAHTSTGLQELERRAADFWINARPRAVGHILEMQQ